MSKTFSQLAVEKIGHILKNHSNHVGNQLKIQNPEKYKDYIASDCITMAIWVLKDAFEKTARADIARRVGSLGHKGTELAKYLIGTHSWQGVYYNPDVNRPYDGEGEHISSYYLQVKKSCTYSVSKVPVSHGLTNYKPSSKIVSKNIGLTTDRKRTTTHFSGCPLVWECPEVGRMFGCIHMETFTKVIGKMRLQTAFIHRLRSRASLGHLAS